MLAKWNLHVQRKYSAEYQMGGISNGKGGGGGVLPLTSTLLWPFLAVGNAYWSRALVTLMLPQTHQSNSLEAVPYVKHRKQEAPVKFYPAFLPLQNPKQHTGSSSWH